MFDDQYIGRRLDDFVSEVAPYTKLRDLRLAGPETMDFGGDLMYSWQIIGEDPGNSSVGKVIYLFPSQGEIWADTEGNLVFSDLEKALKYLEKDLC